VDNAHRASWRPLNGYRFNWTHVGQTTGRGKKSTVHHQIIPIKDIWLYPLRKDFASVLCR